MIMRCRVHKCNKIIKNVSFVAFTTNDRIMQVKMYHFKHPVRKYIEPFVLIFEPESKSWKKMTLDLAPRAVRFLPEEFNLFEEAQRFIICQYAPLIDYWNDGNDESMLTQIFERSQNKNKEYIGPEYEE